MDKEFNEKGHELFRNIIMKPQEGDNRTFEEYEATMDYQFFRSTDGLIETEGGKTYEITGCNTDDGDMAVMIYGYANDLDFQEIKEKPLSDWVKKHDHKGFQIIEIKSDERLFNSEETDSVWLGPFVRYIESIWKGYQADDNGYTEKDIHGLVKLNFTYDYVWIVVKENENIPFKYVQNEWVKINKQGYDYYIKWINQK